MGRKNKNEEIPEGIFERIALATDPNTSAKVLEELARDKDVDVRYVVAKNPSASEEILVKLLKDRDWSVSEAAREKLILRKIRKE